MDTLYVTVVCWRSLAENVAASMAKGDPVVVHGRMRMRQWTSDDGRSGTAVELEAAAAGHDLTRGVSTFTRVKPRETERPGRSEADELAEQVGREAIAAESVQSAGSSASSAASAATASAASAGQAGGAAGAAA